MLEIDKEKSIDSLLCYQVDNITFKLLIVLITLLSLLFAGCSDQKVKTLQLGDNAPDFELKDLTGNLVSTTKSAGKPMVLRFFDPYCKYCKADTVVFNDFYKKHRDQGLKVVYLNIDPDLEVIKVFVEELKIEFPVVIDANREIATRYRVKVVPQTIILSPQHKILGAILGGVSEAELDDLLAEFLE